MLRSRTVREGTVGLFALLGLVLFGGLVIWLRGGGFGQRNYQFVAEFSDVSGLQIGAPVRYRGVTVGKIAAMNPGPKNVDVVLEISSTNVILPRQVRIQTNRYGLIGEASVDITPLGALPSDTQAFNPLSPDCNSQAIICEGDRLKGDPGVQLFENLARLSELYTDPKFFNSITGAAQSASVAAERIAKLSDILARLSVTVNREIQGVSDTTEALTKTANETTQFIDNANSLLAENRSTLQRTLNNTSELANSLNGLIRENRTNLSATLNNIDRTSQELQKLVEQVNTGLATSDTQKIAQNLETLVANAAATSTNLRELSGTINDPANALTLQRILDSARATFENAQKITSDLDDLTGDPAFRDNLRNLVNGLGNLVSSTQNLERQIQTAQALGIVKQELESLTQPPQRFKPYSTTVSSNDAKAPLPYLELMSKNIFQSPASFKLFFEPSSKAFPTPSSFQLQGSLPED